MADLGASDVTYTEVNKSLMDNGYRRNVYAITTAAGDYPTGGLPLDKAQLGCSNYLESLKVLEPSAADAFQYYWDSSAETIMVLVDDGTSGVPAEHANGAFTSPDQLIVEAVGY